MTGPVFVFGVGFPLFYQLGEVGGLETGLEVAQVGFKQMSVLKMIAKTASHPGRRVKHLKRIQPHLIRPKIPRITLNNKVASKIQFCVHHKTVFEDFVNRVEDSNRNDLAVTIILKLQAGPALWVNDRPVALGVGLCWGWRARIA